MATVPPWAMAAPTNKVNPFKDWPAWAQPKASSPYVSANTTEGVLPDYTKMGMTAAPESSLAAIPGYGASLYGGGLSQAGADYTPSFMDGITDTLKGAHQWMQDVGLTGGKNADGSSFNGWGGLALGAAQGIANTYLGMQQYGLMKDQLAFSKQNAERNFNAQKNMVNSQLEDRQNRRVADGLMPNVTPTADYMKKYGVA